MLEFAVTGAAERGGPTAPQISFLTQSSDPQSVQSQEKRLIEMSLVIALSGRVIVSLGLLCCTRKAMLTDIRMVA